MKPEALAGVARALIDASRLSTKETGSRLEAARNPEFWRRLNPGLRVCEELPAPALEREPLTARELERQIAHFRRAGYFHTRPIVDPGVLARMRQCVETLREDKWPPVFSYVYDIFWQIMRTPSLHELIAALIGNGYSQNSHVWTYYVVPVEGARGWPPHRDSSKDGRLTVWMPLSPATLDNGCMYVVPRDGTPENFDIHGNVTAVQMHQVLQSSRALPSDPGAFMGWAHDVVHWGSISSGGDGPRISIGLEFVAGDATPVGHESPLFGPGVLPSFADRLAAIGKALQLYEKFEPLMARYEDLAVSLSGKRYVQSK